MNIKRIATLLLPGVFLFALSPSGLAEETDFEFKGYVKVDAAFSDYGGGALAPNSPLRDFLIPGAIPVGGVSESPELDLHAKESRLIFQTDTPLGGGEILESYVELDFLLPTGGDERVSNSFNPRMRHLFLLWDRGERGSWLAGQYWTTFMIIQLPEDLDFIGTPEGTVFGRNPMVRYTTADRRWQFAVENPETTVTPNGGGARITTDDNNLPDFVARYNYDYAGGTISGALLLRQLKADLSGQGNPAVDDTTYGYGFSVGGRLNVGAENDIRYQATVGSGMGRHFGINFANGAVIDDGNDLEAIDSFGGFVAYRHCWTAGCAWRSNFNYSFIEVDNDTALTGTGANESAFSVSGNLLYSPHPSFTLGVEYTHAERELASGVDGDLDRLQFSVKYAFDFFEGRRKFWEKASLDDNRSDKI